MELLKISSMQEKMTIYKKDNSGRVLKRDENKKQDVLSKGLCNYPRKW